MSWLLFLHFLFQQNKSDDFFSVSAKCSYMKNRCVSSGSANIYSVVRIIEGVKNFNIIFCELPFSAAAVGQNLYLMHISEIFNAKKWEFLSYMYTHIRVHLSYQTFRSALWSEKFHDKFSFSMSDFQKNTHGNIEGLFGVIEVGWTNSFHIALHQ